MLNCGLLQRGLLDPCRNQRLAHAQRGLGSDGFGDFHRAIHHLIGLGDFLDQAHVLGLFRTELITGQQVAHGVAPADVLDEACGRSADRVDTALNLDLAKAGAGGRHANIAGQHQLDADGVANPVDGVDQRLGDTTVRVQAHRVAKSRVGLGPGA